MTELGGKRKLAVGEMCSLDHAKADDWPLPCYRHVGLTDRLVEIIRSQYTATILRSKIKRRNTIYFFVYIILQNTIDPCFKSNYLSILSPNPQTR